MTAADLINILKSFDINQFVGVPCSNLKDFIRDLDNNYINSYNESEALAYAVGAFLAGTRIGIITQNSGLPNMLNGITSLQHIYQIPIVLLIGYRGAPDVSDEPQHDLIGKLTTKWLSDCNIEVIELSNYLACELSERLQTLISNNKSVAILIRKNDFEKNSITNINFSNNNAITNMEVLRIVSEYRDSDTTVITPTGYISRTMYTYFDNPKNFYVVGSMGESLAIGLGMARYLPKSKIVVINGDGAVLMRPQSIFMLSDKPTNNLLHIVLDNNSYNSTGSQNINAKHLPTLLKSFYDSNYVSLNNIDDLKNFYNNFISGRLTGGYCLRIPVQVNDIDVTKLIRPVIKL